MVKLSKIITQVRGVSYKPNDVILEKKAGYTCLLRANNIDRGELKFDDVVYVDSARVKNTQLLRAEDILICASSGSRHLVGKAACVIGDMNVTFGAFCKVIRPLAEYAPFLGWFFKSPRYRMQISNASAGVNINNIRAEDIDNMEIDLLTVKQREEAVCKLNAITHLISLRQRQAEKLDELVKARFVEMFGDPVRTTKHWEKASLLALGSCKNGMSFHANESGIKLRCLGVGDFKNLSYIDDVEQLPFVSLAEKPSPNCFLHDGDIVFVRSNGNKALVGRCLLVYPRDTPTIYSGFCIRYRLVTEKVDPIYALHVLKADGIRQKMSGRGANIQNLNQKILAAIEMPIPPLPLQNAFATFVYEVDREKERIQRSAALLETLKRSLMQQYFG